MYLTYPSIQNFQQLIAVNIQLTLRLQSYNLQCIWLNIVKLLSLFLYLINLKQIVALLSWKPRK